jgi:putative ABC transport system substrate-binding protein
VPTYASGVRGEGSLRFALIAVACSTDRESKSAEAGGAHETAGVHRSGRRRAIRGGSSQAQQPGKLYRVGVLSADTAPPGLLEDFEEELRKLGYVRGENIIVEERNAAGDYRRLALLADELVKLGVDVILAVNTPAVQAAKKVTARIPIVMTRVANPVKTGLVPSLSKPGGNITGMSFFPDELSAKRLQLLKEVLPSVSRVAVLSDEGNVGTTLVIGEMEAPSRQLGIELLVLSVSGPGDFVGAFEAAKRGHAEALILVDNAFFTKHRAEILDRAAKHSLPVFSLWRPFAEAGALMAYGARTPPIYRRAAHYVDRILKGASPADLPVEQPTEFELTINLKTARALSIEIPLTLLARADEVIE